MTMMRMVREASLKLSPPPFGHCPFGGGWEMPKWVTIPMGLPLNNDAQRCARSRRQR